MTQEEKDLLLKDLCARLPYGVIVVTPKGNGHLCSINQTIFGNEYGINIKATQRDYFNDRDCDIKPYLRPMSSMTDEENKEISTLLNYEFYVDDDYALVAEDDRHRVRLDLIQIYTNWLLENHFDFMDLIPKGLALEAPEGMYN